MPNTQKNSYEIPHASNNSGSDKNYNINKEIFKNAKEWKDVTNYNLMRGVPDFGDLVQFNPYETGYAAFIICDLPKFIKELAKKDNSPKGYQSLIQNWAHIIEYEFKSFSGLEDISAETFELGDELNKINIINRVTMQRNSEFTLTYDEKSGSPLTKFAKLYLTGLKDPRTQVKSYHGLIHSGEMEPGFENEVFTFLFIATDNTMRKVEAAYLLIGCQLLSAQTSMYNYSKGDIGKAEVEVRFSGYPVTSSTIDGAASDLMGYLLSNDAGKAQIRINSTNFEYGKTTKSIGRAIANDAVRSSGTYKNIKNIDDKADSFYTDSNNEMVITNFD